MLLFSSSYLAAITLISTFTFLGNPLTATVSLAGKLFEKYFPYTSFTMVNRLISDRKIFVFSTWI